MKRHRAALEGLALSVIAVVAAAPCAADEAGSEGEEAAGYDAPWSDNRLSDRFFFGLYAGGAFASATDAATDEERSAVGEAVGFETAFLPNDFIGLGVDVEVVSLDLSEPHLTTLTAQTGLYGTLSVPLRWVRPYAGGWAGLRTSSAADRPSGVRAVLQPLAGMDVYLGRNVRFFAQWRSVPLDFETQANRMFHDVLVDEVSGGMRWSPDVFHEARGMDKFNVVWWSGLFCLVTFGIVTWIGA